MGWLMYMIHTRLFDQICEHDVYVSCYIMYKMLYIPCTDYLYNMYICTSWSPNQILHFYWISIIKNKSTAHVQTEHERVVNHIKYIAIKYI